MARRYVRDNRGRFASKGSGATARGGRLKTASGKKRETQTIKASSGGVAGTIGKPKGLKSGTIKSKSSQLSSQQKRDIKSQQIEASRSASRNSARMGNVGNTPAQEAAYAKAAKADRARADALGKKLEGQSAPPTVFARSSRIKGEEIGGKYKGKGKTSLYGKDLAKTSAARPGSTVRKPAGLKPGALTAKPATRPATKPARQKMSDAEKTIRAAQRRLKTKQYGYTANQAQALATDRRLAKMTPQQLAASRVKGARAYTQRLQRNLRQGKADNAPASYTDRMKRSLAQRRAEFKAAAADYRVLNPKNRKNRK